MDNPEPVVVGSIGAPHGVRGWVRINSFTDPSDNLFVYPLLLQVGFDDWQPVEIEEVKPHGKGYVAKLAKIDDRNQAALITNAKLAVPRDEMPDLEDDEFYWSDMMGLTVFNQDNIELGKVVDIFATGANDVMLVQSGDKEHLIPCIPQMYVVDVNLDNKQIKVIWDLEI